MEICAWFGDQGITVAAKNQLIYVSIKHVRISSIIRATGGIPLPDNIQFQYDNTKTKREELEEICERKLQELSALKQTLREKERKARCN